MKYIDKMLRLVGPVIQTYLYFSFLPGYLLLVESYLLNQFYSPFPVSVPLHRIFMAESWNNYFTYLLHWFGDPQWIQVAETKERHLVDPALFVAIH